MPDHLNITPSKCDQDLGEGKRNETMPSSSSKKQGKQHSQPPSGERQLRSKESMASSSAHAILVPVSAAQRAQTHTGKMAQRESPTRKAPEIPAMPSQEIEVDTDAITGPILEAIAASKTELVSRIDCLASECNLIRHDLDKIRGRLTTAEDRISEVEDASHTQGSQLNELKDMVRALQRRADDAEDRQRRNNVRVVGLPEGVEGSTPSTFAEQFFKSLLSLGDLPPTYVAERAHRVPTGARPSGAPPRPFLVRFLNYKDRDMLLAEARKHQDLKYENARIMLFPDFSAETQRRRRSFTEVKRRLREMELKYSMLYPSRLRVQFKGSVKFFDTPQEACDWLDTNP